MVGPNAAGKSNVLHALEFLGDMTRDGIEPAPAERGGFGALAFRGGPNPVSKISVGVEGVCSNADSDTAIPHEQIAICVPTNQMAAETAYTLKLHGIDSVEIRSDGPNGSTGVHIGTMFRFKGWNTSAWSSRA